MMDLFLIVLCHKGHSLSQLDHTALPLSWKTQYEAPDKGQKYAGQTLKVNDRECQWNKITISEPI